MAKRATKRLVKKTKARRRKKPVILPKVMSKLIGIALADMKKAEAARDKYVIDLGIWHQPAKIQCELKTRDGDSMFSMEQDVLSERNVCVLCAAGSVMEFSLNAATDKEFEPHHFPKNQKQLSAINDLRCGDVSSAAYRLGLAEVNRDGYRINPGEFDDFDCDIPDYDRKNPKPFHAAMTKLQKRLEKAGL